MSAQPTLIPEPWANHGSRTNIPETTSDAGRASWALGFPPETAQPLNSGGVPPHWLDFQGVLYALSAHAVFGQCGGRYRWANTIDYPVGACIIDSNGNVYQAVQESGPGTAAGAKNPASAANADYWGQMAAPDGTTIKVVNGRLTAIDQSTSAADLADNVTTVANNNKLSVNLTNATAAALKNISQYLVENGGGLKMNTASGELFVDFENMPTDKFEALLKSLKMQIPLSANKQVYVDGTTGADTIEDGRGTKAKPFKTIAACVNWVTQNYAMGRYNVYINIASGDYIEAITLPTFTRTTGAIVLRPEPPAAGDPPAASPTVRNAASTESVFGCTGGRWILERLNIAASYSDPSDGLNHFVSAARADGSGASLSIRGCTFAISYTGGAPAAQFYLRTVAAYGGAAIELAIMSGYHNSFDCSPGAATGSNVLHAERGAQINIPTGSIADTGAEYSIQCSGSVGVFCSTTSDGTVTYVGGGLYPQQFAGTMNGQQYEARNGSHILAPPGGFPGDTAGTVESATYCWYKQA